MKFVRSLVSVIVVTLGIFAVFAAASAPPVDPTPADTWPSPPVLQNTSAKPGVVELDLTASPTRLELVPGKMTEAWAYNGSVPVRVEESAVSFSGTDADPAIEPGVSAPPPPPTASRN